ncbi:hypothetical protein ACFL1X_01445 [Candidatus Hydrogenedentota bacterium]
MKRNKLLTTVLMSACLVRTVAGRSYTLEDILRPFEFLSAERIYQHYGNTIDFVVFLLLFIGVTEATLSRRFPGKGGKLMSLAVGTSLAAGLVLAERQLGFDLRSFGSAAVAVLAVVLGITVFEFLKYSGTGTVWSAASAYILSLLVMKSVTPEFFMWLEDTVPLLHLAVNVSMLFAVLEVLSPLIIHSSLEKKLRSVEQNQSSRVKGRKAEEKEAKFIKRRVKPIAKKAVKESNIIQKDLESISKAIQRDGGIPDARGIIATQIKRVLPEEHALFKDIRNLLEMNERLLRFDTSVFSQKSREQLNGMNDKERALFKKELSNEVEKIDLEKKVRRIEQSLENHVRETAKSVNAAGEALLAGRARDAQNLVGAAIAGETSIQKLADAVKQLEGQLLALTKRDVKLEKKMAKI